MSKPRILFVNSFYAPEIGGGAEMTLHRLASGLIGRGYDVSAFTTGERETVDEVDGVTVYRVPIDNAFRKLSRDLPGRARRAMWQWRDRSSPLTAARLRAVVERVKPDVVQFHNLSGLTKSVWDVPASMGLPSIQVVHDLYLLCPTSSMYARGRACETQCTSCRLFRRGFAEASRSVNAVVGVSRFVVDRVVREGYFPRATKRHIYNAQHVPDPAPLPNGDKLHFGFVGSIAPPKGVEWLIRQFDNSMGRLSIAGTGSATYLARLHALAAGKDITFLGHVDPIAFFRSVDIGVVPSIWNEALGNVAIEASALGRPVIATRRGGLPEIVRDGETGILVDPDRPDTLGAAMRALSQDRDLLVRYGAAGPAAVRKFTDPTRFIDEYVGLIGQVCDRAVGTAEG